MKRMNSDSGTLNSQTNKILEVAPKLAYKDNPVSLRELPEKCNYLTV